jgi:hypothetical protein
MRICVRERGAGGERERILQIQRRGHIFYILLGARTRNDQTDAAAPHAIVRASPEPPVETPANLRGAAQAMTLVFWHAIDRTKTEV